MYKDELQQVIRFAISQLSAQNGQADFEKICLFFSRGRIHVNILPATGPVQAGGDQGRDFETFHSYLASSPNASSLLIGKFSGHPVAFACSLEKEPISPKGKIYKDVKSIMASGNQVERIYFFSGQDIAVAKRHKFQEAIKKEFKVDLEIIDAQTLSQQLCDSDLFWIAIQYLKIPSDYFPKNIDEDWYTSLYAEYKKREKDPITFEEFAEIKAAVRHIYKDAELKSDLLFWIPWFDKIIHSNQVPDILIRNSIYEKFVASLIGLNNIEGQEGNIVRYFDNIEDYSTNSELADAQILLSFCLSSKSLIGHDLTLEYMTGIQQKLETLILTKLDSTENVDGKCELLEIHASLLLHKGKHDPIKGVQKYFARLKSMLPLIPKTHFYPIERLSDRTNEMIERLLPSPFDITELEDFAAKVDHILAKKGGRDIVASKLRSRAANYLKNGETTKAIDTLHDLKIKWFKHDTLDGTILSCLLLCKAYRTLDMHYAAKYYALVAAFLAFKSKDVSLSHRITSAISMAADIDYETGSWLNFLDLIDFLIMLHSRITKDFDVYDHDDTHRILYYPSVIVKTAEMFLQQALPVIDNRMKEWGFIKNDIYELKATKLDGLLEFNDNENLSRQLADQIDGRIFNDIGGRREIVFNALGCNWHFSFANEYLSCAVAEQFISMFQIILTDISKDELYIIPTKISIEISVSDSTRPDFERIASNHETICKVALPNFKGNTLKQLQDHEFGYFAVTQQILTEVSLLPIEEYKQILGKKFANNLFEKISFGRPYAELYQHFISEEHVISSQRMKINHTVYPQPFEPKENSKLKWNDSTAPKYDARRSMEAIRNRLTNLQKPLSITLPLLKKSEGFLQVVYSLRKKGYLDWQILHCVASIVINYKAQFRDNPKAYEEIQRTAMDYFMKDESLWYKEIPLDILTEDRLEQELSMIFIATMLPGFDLEQRSITPDGRAIEKLLRHRFNFFEDGKEMLVF